MELLCSHQFLVEAEKWEAEWAEGCITMEACNPHMRQQGPLVYCGVNHQGQWLSRWQEVKSAPPMQRKCSVGMRLQQSPKNWHLCPWEPADGYLPPSGQDTCQGWAEKWGPRGRNTQERMWPFFPSNLYFLPQHQKIRKWPRKVWKGGVRRNESRLFFSLSWGFMEALFIRQGLHVKWNKILKEFFSHQWFSLL